MGSDFVGVVFALLAVLVPLGIAALIVWWQSQPVENRKNWFKQ